jgi:hypothetical protein
VIVSDDDPVDLNPQAKGSHRQQALDFVVRKSPQEE